MSKTCRIVPPIKGSNEDSKLYKDLLSFTNDRDLSLRTKYWSESDKASKYNLERDSKGEVTLEALVKRFDLSREIPLPTLINNMKKNLGTVKADGSNKVYISESDAFDKTSEFNKTSPFKHTYVATYGRVPAGDNASHSGFTVRINKKNTMNSLDASKVEYNYKLNQKIRDILTKHGIGVGGLNELEKRMQVHGATDFSTAAKTAEGLKELIRIADGVNGEKALPEEFGHFIVESLEQHPLVSRLLNLLAKDSNFKEVLGDEYEQYDHLYNSNPILLAKEAAGKLLYKSLLKNESIKPSIHSNLLSRVISYFKTLFSTKGKQGLGTDITSAMMTLETGFNKVATDVLDGTMNKFIDVAHATKQTATLYQVSAKIDKDSEMLKKIIETESKRLKIFNARKNGQGFDDSQRVLLSQLEADYDSHKELDGIYRFLSETNGRLTSIDNRYNELRNLTEGDTINQMASVLRDAKDFLAAYNPIFEQLSNNIQEANRNGDDKFKLQIEQSFKDTRALLTGLQDQYSELALPLLSKFLEPWVGDSLKVSWGKDKNRVRTLQEVLTAADKDIGFMDRWMNAVADTNNPMLRLMDHAVKMTKEEGRLEIIKIQKELQAQQLILESKGIKGNEFMFEKDSDNRLTGRYISKINTLKFSEDYKAFRELMNAKYPTLSAENMQDYTNEKIAWETEHVNKISGKSFPKESKYVNPAYSNLSQAEKDYYEKVLEIKEKLDSYLPDKFRDQNKAVQIRKDLVERLKAHPTGAGKELWESIKDSVVRRSDDTDIEHRSVENTDFNSKLIQVLPVYYTSMLEDPNSLSTDVTSTMTAYAAMAVDFDKMNKVIDTLELGRDLVKNMNITQNKSGRPIVEKLTTMGKTIEKKVTSRGDGSRIMERMDDFFDMQVYGNYSKDAGTVRVFGQEVDIAKTANTLNRITSLNVLGLNALSGFSNIGTGTTQMAIEAASKEFFNSKNLVKADANYTMTLAAFVNNIGNRVKFDKLSLWNELFNTMQDYEQGFRELDMDRKSLFSKLLNTNTLFFLNHAGEHFMQTRTSLAVADATKMKDKNGVIHSLFESMEVVDEMRDGIKVGAKLQVKDGYTKEDGSEFTDADIINFSAKVKKINQRMHGIYNKADMNAFQHSVTGKLVSMFRKWLVPSFNRRFQSHNFDYDLQTETEGYYSTSGNFVANLYKDARKGQFLLATRWNELNPKERANIVRAITEVGMFTILSIAMNLITFSKDKNRPWAAKMLEYQMRRLHLEMGSMIPINYQFPKQALQLLSSPSASISYVNKILELGNIGDYGKMLNGGKYKGHTILYKDLMELLPMKNSAAKSLNPDLGLAWFKVNN